tara:strand:- start:411 stop:785 length:375 start_codon:yes stop_codon:yes gene_type:complete
MKGKIGLFLLGFTSSILLFLSIFLLLGKDNIRKYYYFLDSSFRQKLYNKNNLKGSDFKSCLPEIISHVPNKSSIVIGHAYGRGKSKLIRKNLNPKVDRFLQNNKENIETLFLTGDVFNMPSLSK